METKKEKYGDEHYNNTEQRKETCLKKYGYEHILQSPYYQEVMKQNYKN
jgi:hypothetical protein